MEPNSETFVRKRQLRVEALARRGRQPHRDELSRQILARLVQLPEYVAARTVFCYINLPSEVQTQPFLPTVWQQRKTLVVPWCQDERIELFGLESFEELTTGGFGLLEPRAQLRGLPERRVEPQALDLIVVPGVAFDPHGGRLGHGKGYFDRFLSGVSPRVPRVALAFQCQIFPEVPTTAHDVPMSRILTEETEYEGRPWSSAAEQR